MANQIDIAVEYQRVKAERERIIQFLDEVLDEPKSAGFTPGSYDFDRVRDRAGLARGILSMMGEQRP